MKIKSIDIVLENCEVVTIESDYILAIDFGNCHTNYSADRWNKNILKEDIYCKELYLVIHNGGNKDYYEFGIEEDSYKTTVFNRLMESNDITSIEMNFENGENKIIRISWANDNEWENSYQTSEIEEKSGYLVIRVER